MLVSLFETFYGLIKLCRFDESGLRYINRSMRFIVLSFIVIIPLYYLTQFNEKAALRLFSEVKELEIPVSSSSISFLLFAFLTLIERYFFGLIAWVMKLERYIFPTISVLNWLDLLMILPLSLLAGLYLRGFIPGEGFTFLALIYEIYALCVMVFVIQKALIASLFHTILLVGMTWLGKFFVLVALSKIMGTS